MFIGKYCGQERPSPSPPPPPGKGEEISCFPVFSKTWKK